MVIKMTKIVRNIVAIMGIMLIGVSINIFGYKTYCTVSGNVGNRDEIVVVADVATEIEETKEPRSPY